MHLNNVIEKKKENNKQLAEACTLGGVFLEEPHTLQLLLG